MHRTFPGFRVLAAMLAIAAPAMAHAQSPLSVFSFGVGGGLTLPVSDLREAAEQGYHGQVMLAVNVPLFPIAARFDAAYHRLPTGDAGHLRQFSATANGRVAGVGLPITPYIIGGIGVYNSRFTEPLSGNGFAERGTEARTDFGINAGAGVLLRLGVLQGFAEARYHHLFDGGGLAHVPVTVGVLF